MKIDGIPELKGNWTKPFLEIVLRGLRKANFNFESWNLNQIPTKLENSDFECLNNGWGVFKSPEEHTCSYITQEFATSPFTKGYWVASDENGIKGHRWYMIERELHIAIKNVYPNSDFSIWDTKINSDNSKEDELKNQVFDSSTSSRWADMLINRIDYNSPDFDIIIEPWEPAIIEAKRVSLIESKINYEPNFSELKSNYKEIIKDVRKLLGLKIGLSNSQNTSFKHPHPLGSSKDFFPLILFWGLKAHCDSAIEELKKGISIKYQDKEYETSNWYGLCKEYPHCIMDNKSNKRIVLKIVLLEFEHKMK